MNPKEITLTATVSDSMGQWRRETHFTMSVDAGTMTNLYDLYVVRENFAKMVRDVTAEPQAAA